MITSILSTILKIIVGLLALNVIVFFHELGHFIFAKIFGVKVLSFSIGMGPVLLHKEINGTDYRISAIPLGGYCGMEGEKDFQKAIEEKLDSLPKNKDSLYGVHPAKRALIAFAGPLFNFIISVFAFAIMAMIGYSMYTFSNKIIVPDDLSIQSPAREAGILSGDRIIQINETKIDTFADIQQAVGLSPKETLDIKINRDGSILDFSVKTIVDENHGNGLLGVTNSSERLEIPVAPKSFFPALFEGVKQTHSMIKMTFKTFKILFSGVDVTNVVAGPARVSYMLGETMQSGFSSSFKEGLLFTLQLIAIISISLGIMNLLPIPILDGGLILFAIIAIIFKKEVPPRIQYKIQFIGIAVIAFLFVLGMFGDIKYFVKMFRSPQ
ncbi:M50 family metallopeptidase [Treponema sp.]|uniref:M50 family metallopeptidase n=1 Tax=Treponema sp. TaxID=166 RepID=UPI00298D7AC7|nr:site-2 protease family protein [Treponema sp.]